MGKNILIFLGCVVCFSAFSQEVPCASAKIAAFPGASARSVIDSAHLSLEDEYDVHYYKLDIDVERDTTYISGNTLIMATALQPIDTFTLELHPNLAVDSASVNNQTVTFYRDSNSLDLVMPQTFVTGSQLNVLVYYHGTPPNDHSSAIGSGFNNGTDEEWNARITWNLSEPYSAYEWWPCKQALNDKADSSAVSITTDSSNMAGSNGLLVDIVSLPGGKKRYDWKSSFPIDYYLISVSVGDYVDHSVYAHPAGSDSILIQSYVYNNPALFQLFNYLDNSVEIMELFCNLYGPYPFQKEKYGHCMAPLGGGMEHQTMTTLNGFDFTLIAHEMTHQWFGDNITCGTWSDIWLNEGFASYGEYLSMEYFYPDDAPGYMQTFHQYVMSSPGGSVYCTDTSSVGRIFDSRLSYRKGASALHMIRYLMGDSTYFGALKYYLKLYHNSVATTNELRDALEQYSGMDLNDFFTQWIYGEGFPTYNVKWYQLDDKLYLQVAQTVSSPDVTPLFTIPIPYEIRYAENDTTIKLAPGAAVQQYVIPVSDKVKNITVDPDGWILGQSTVTYDSIFAFGMISETNGQLFNLYPNPVSSQLLVWVQSPSVATKMQIFGSDGREWLNAAVSTGTNIISTGSLSAGTYLILLTGNSGNTLTTRFIKQ